MNRSLLRMVAAHLISTPAMQNLLDWRFGMKLLRDGRVPVRSKLGAFALGLAAFFILDLMELPIELAVATVLPLLGIVLNFAVDGIEFLVIPSLVAILALQFTAPKEIVAQIRGHKNGFDNFDSHGRVYDVAGSKIN